MLWLVSSIRGIEPIRNWRVSSSSRSVAPSRPSAPTSCVDGRDRALDVRRIDAGADHERPRPEARIERAERVVRHPLPLADVLRQPSAEPELAEDVVHHPVMAVRRIEPADAGEAVGDVGLRLVRHLDRGLLPRRAGARRAARSRSGAGTASHPSNAARRPARRRRPRARRRRSTTNSADGAKRAAWYAARSLAPNPLDALDACPSPDGRRDATARRAAPAAPRSRGRPGCPGPAGSR